MGKGSWSLVSFLGWHLVLLAVNGMLASGKCIQIQALKTAFISTNEDHEKKNKTQYKSSCSLRKNNLDIIDRHKYD